MKHKELSSLKPEDLAKKEREVRDELIKLEAQVAIGTTPKSPGQLKQLKKTLARIQTIKRQQPTEVKEQHA
ncbi:50S ribosomal protein L29 [Candidatus Woesearchaeota archaeon]|nr:50S ribosomal protein L29 [Candidatus Woesearchaeota archaeon]